LVSPAPRAPTRRRRLLAASLIVTLAAAAGTSGFLFIGRFMAYEDQLQPSDAIFVFAGTMVERPLEAADLFRDGYAPVIVVTRAVVEQATFQLERRGVRIPTEHDLNKEVLLEVGVPPAALIAPRFVHDNTAEEARTLRELALEREWRRVILVTSKYHLRRARLAAQRALRGTDVQVLARGSRYDPSMPARWWTRRSDIRWLATEVPKLIVYGLGIG
jgi:uncharacterized SAM-binding protein YcdF (DUF218 family)